MNQGNSSKGSSSIALASLYLSAGLAIKWMGRCTSAVNNGHVE